jgi:hypothetical protein
VFDFGREETLHDSFLPLGASVDLSAAFNA